MPTDPAFEGRLEALREEAGRTGTVRDRGIAIAGGPIPPAATAPVAYYGQPIVKPPVWTWQIGLYFFVGGTAGMSGVLALAGLLTGQPLAFVRTALAVAFAGALVSPALLIADLGRPARFLNMLRVFKWRSAMSMGVWTLVAFSGFATAALLLMAARPLLTPAGVPSTAWRVVLFLAAAGTAAFGALLATYTGVLLGATAVPVWSSHHRLLPFHFGAVALGSASAILELLGFQTAALQGIGLTVASIETAVGAWLETRGGAEARSLTHGESGLLMRMAGLCTGPATLVLRALVWTPAAAVCFLLGAVLSRYGWLHAGRASARDPEETLAAQRGSP
jgi:Polysulphide reductase, NrfD